METKTIKNTTAKTNTEANTNLALLPHWLELCFVEDEEADKEKDKDKYEDKYNYKYNCKYRY